MDLATRRGLQRSQLHLAQTAGQAMVLAAIVDAVAAVGLYVTTAPAAISLAVEPLSLLLTPGAVVGMVLGALVHLDPAASLIVTANFVVYFIVFWAVLLWRARSRRRSASALDSSLR